MPVAPLRTVLGMFRRYRGLLVPVLGAVVAGAVVAGVALATDPTPPRPTTSANRTIPKPSTGALAFQQAIVDVVQSVSPSVVQIEDQKGLGSGIVLDTRGHIVTNSHVVAGGTSFVVTTQNGSRYPARLVGSFPADDLAVIKISATGLHPATFADSSTLQVGDIAVAIGNPLGLRSSVTQGIVSAFREAVQEDSNVTLPLMIQTSADINPGNSGGALVDLAGHVIGIPTLAATDPEFGGSAPGIGFALPSNLVKEIAGQIVENGRVVDSHRAYLGVRVGDTNGQGVYVASVKVGGAAAKAGIHVGDVIASVDGTPTSTTNALSAVLSQLKPGRVVPIVVRRQDGMKASLDVTLATYPGT
jgi:putative serine protease PepD